MPRPVRLKLALLICTLALTACGGSTSPAEAPDDPAAPPADSETPPTDDPAPARHELTAEACEAGGGSVFGDIGDGAIHRPD
jgi:hypothetical protein